MYKNRYGEFKLKEVVKVASNHGRAVGMTISGKAQPFVKVPIFWSARTFFTLWGFYLHGNNAS